MYRGYITVNDLGKKYTHARYRTPETRRVDPGPAQFDNASNLILLCRTRGWCRGGRARYCLVRKKKAIITRELFETDGEKKSKGDNYEDLACECITEPTAKLAFVFLGRY
jgi:hypothetical protein